LIKIRSPEDRKKQQNLTENTSITIITERGNKTDIFSAGKLPKLEQFSAPRVLKNDFDFASIASLDLLGASKEDCQWDSKALQCHENEICLCFNQRLAHNKTAK
jgi:hypothetical protein